MKKPRSAEMRFSVSFSSAHSIYYFSCATMQAQGGLNMEKYITDERTGLKYELVGDYYFIAGEDEPEKAHPVGVWGQRRLRYLKEHRQVLYTALLLSGKLDDHLADIDEQAEALLSELVKQMAQRQGITEALKAADQMLWVQRMNNIRNAAQEVVLNDLIYE
jgi:hypothetical protein